MAERNLSHKDAEQVLQKNGGVPPKKIVQKSFVDSIKVDMNVLVNKAKDFREIMKEQKEKRFRERQEKRDRDRTDRNDVQLRLIKEKIAENEKRKLTQETVIEVEDANGDISLERPLSVSSDDFA